jgi:HK97 family phage major capsid protein
MPTPAVTSRHPNQASSWPSFFSAVRRAGRREGPGPVVLRPYGAAPSTAAQEAAGPDGGYLVPPDFQKAVSDAILAETDLLGRCTIVETERNNVVLPVDVQPAYSATGLQAAQQPENSALAQSKLSLGSRSVRLSKLSIYMPMTNELLEDAQGLDAYLVSIVAQKFSYLINSYLLTGDGVNKPLGVLNSPAAITIAAEGAQPTATIVLANLQKMFARLIPSLRPSAVWLVHTSAEQAMLNITQTGFWVAQYSPGSPFASLFGLPVIPIEAASVVGTVGDITLIGMAGILAAIRPGLVKRQFSMDCYFDLDMNAFRFTVRLGAMPALAAPVAQKNGGSTVSSIVSLAARP